MCLCNNYARTCGGGGAAWYRDPLFFFFLLFFFFGRVTLFMVGLSCRPQVQKAHTLLSIPPHALGADWHVGRGYTS